MRGARHLSSLSVLPVALCVAAWELALPGGVAAAGGEGELEIYWVDVEGGAATLVVTPAGESILVDAGRPGERDPSRIHRLATEVAGLERIDHLVVTHFDIDHYGGAVDLSRRMPIGRVWDPGLPGSHPFDRRGPDDFADYVEATRGRRTVIEAGDVLPLKQRPEAERGIVPKLEVRCLAAKQRFVSPRPGQRSGDCGRQETMPIDRSENRNSVVLLFTFGPFRFLDAADLTWNLERQLVCPVNLVGHVDVFQADHHGLDRSNNPALIRSIEPRVVVINNGPRKGCEPRMFATLKETSSVAAIYQLHRNVRVGDDGNTAPERIANAEADCEAHHVELSVNGAADRYTVSVPSTGHVAAYGVR